MTSALSLSLIALNQAAAVAVGDWTAIVVTLSLEVEEQPPTVTAPAMRAVPHAASRETIELMTDDDSIAASLPTAPHVPSTSTSDLRVSGSWRRTR
jgi:hypothetical protein